MRELLSYAQLIKDRKNFRRSGTINDDFNLYDTPSHKYFKILFYFGGTDEKANEAGNANGLLHPTWEIFPKPKNESYNREAATNGLRYFDYNSAWSYLMLNDEVERANKLESFVTLLSNINTFSPWYFSAVGGLQEALERKVAEDGKLEMSESKKLTITCLPDAYDNRLTTMLDLYRDITWSWSQKKEIVPANLRKFDMAIYIFESPMSYWDDDVIGSDSSEYKPSYKMIEFHDCEFNYNSIKSGWNELSNAEGFTPTYTIEISYNDCYEVGYNEFVMKKIGDVIANDTYQAVVASGDVLIDTPMPKKDAITSNATYNDKGIINNKLYAPTSNNDSNFIVTLGNLADRQGSSTAEINKQYKYEYEPGFVANAVGQVAGHLIADVDHHIKRAVLGNIYTYSLTQIGAEVSEAASGNLIKAGMSAAQYIKEANQRKASKTKTKPKGNIFNNSTIANNI